VHPFGSERDREVGERFMVFDPAAVMACGFKHGDIDTVLPQQVRGGHAGGAGTDDHNPFVFSRGRVSGVSHPAGAKQRGESDSAPGEKRPAVERSVRHLGLSGGHCFFIKEGQLPDSNWMDDLGEKKPRGSVWTSRVGRALLEIHPPGSMPFDICDPLRWRREHESSD